MAGGLAYALLTSGGHSFTDQQCLDCHVTTPIKGKRETLAMRAPVRDLCIRCHKSYLDNALTHPVGMVPSNATVPADMPLSWDGKMTCSTCHDIHASPPGVSSSTRAYLRRNAIGAELCFACHGKTAGSGGNKHTAGMTVAHMKFTPSVDKSAERIDKVSQMCLGCHDGSLGTEANSQISAGSWKHGSSFSPLDPQGSHPIGMKYRAAERRGGFRSAGSLNKAIRLVGGKVGCSSCHDPFSRLPFLLVVSNATLCTECHNK
jgi:predicted CXXCH cytochrome family protein